MTTKSGPYALHLTIRIMDALRFNAMTIPELCRYLRVTKQSLYTYACALMKRNVIGAFNGPRQHTTRGNAPRYLFLTERYGGKFSPPRAVHRNVLEDEDERSDC